MSIGVPKVPEDDVHFLLFTRRNPTTAQELLVNDPTGLAQSTYDPTLPTKIFAHGWTMNGLDDTCLAMKDEFLANQDCNFISVDWQLLATAPDYPSAVLNVAIVGTHLGDFINYLMTRPSASISRFHLIGFSLGAHVVGLAGKSSTRVLPRITGLDPAWPGFTLTNTDGRLDASDAAFVDIIHTNSGTLLQGALSFIDPIGHVDFYPNGGSSQPGCGLNVERADVIDLINGCSHGRAPAYFTESINGSPAFAGVKCDTYDNWSSGMCASGLKSNMGLNVNTAARGEYYLDTNDAAPFALG